MNQNESLFGILKLLYRWRKHILGASLLVALCTAGVSLLLPNYYQSHTTFYAASPDFAKPAPIGGNPDSRFMYGTDHDVDRLFSIGGSNPIMEYLTEEFNLYEHYEVDKNKPNSKHKLSLKFDKLYKINKTKYDAIEILVEDKDPEFAKKMANAAREKINQIAQNIIKDSQETLMNSYKESIADRQDVYTTLLDSLDRMKLKYKIFSSEAQAEAYGLNMVEVEGKYLNASSKVSFLQSIYAPQDSIAKVKAEFKGLERQFNKLKEDVVLFNKGYPIVENLETRVKDISGQVSVTKTRLSAMQSVFNADISAIHIIEEASVPVYKSRPRRSILVVGAALISFILMSLWVIVTDQIKN